MIDGSFNLWSFLGFYLQANLSSSSVLNLDELMSLPSIQRDWLRAEQGWVNQIQLLSRLFWTFTKNLIKKVDQSRVVDKWTLESKVWTRGTKNWWNITERKLGAKTTYWQVQLFTQHPLLVVWPALWDIAPSEKIQSLKAQKTSRKNIHFDHPVHGVPVDAHPPYLYFHLFLRRPKIL